MSLKFLTKNVAVYEALRKDMIEGRLKPGQKIIMSDVAKEFGLSDIPVREAIRRLESEGYVHVMMRLRLAMPFIRQNTQDIPSSKPKRVCVQLLFPTSRSIKKYRIR